ncbi:hypothetical protein N7539_008858 [Penicillium diatomitis]|uniref:Uncharacterized protein n=1 Tax=Penicillium diatomitis TaxID=2819901 RepID=A0A9W9WKM2_9EURO|nr:uncharacterized protein N7539_008858 [Penicillium diatomitis]KAJ5469240.1 hypothetical protein N7539_008858 [Penicillium diatomitis]
MSSALQTRMLKSKLEVPRVRLQPRFVMNITPDISQVLAYLVTVVSKIAQSKNLAKHSKEYIQ